jgi:hypothetical protein
MKYYLVKQSIDRKIKIVSKSDNRGRLESMIEIMINCSFATPALNGAISTLSPCSYKLLTAEEFINLAIDYDIA